MIYPHIQKMIFQTKLNGSRILHQALIPETVAIKDGRRVAQKKQTG